MVVLGVTGLARPRWVALVAVVLAIAYLLPNYSFVNSHYGLTSSIGNFFGNIKSPGVANANGVPTPASHKFIADCTFLLSAGIWGLALVGAWLRRKARRIVAALLVLTYSPILVLVAGAYGNEGIMRVYLYSLPWAAALAACALAPLRPSARRHRARTNPAYGDGGPRIKSGWGEGAQVGLRAVLPIALAIALFLPALYGDDSSNEMTPDQVNTLIGFQNNAAPGPVLSVINNFAFSDTANYNIFPITYIFGTGGAAPNGPITSNIAAYLARTMVEYTGELQTSYIIMTPSMEAYNQAFGVTAPNNLKILLASLAESPYWKPLVNHDGVMVYQLSSAARTIKTGPYTKTLTIGIP
jgi:hypothetical protein